MQTNVVLRSLLGATLLCSSLALAQQKPVPPPRQNVSGKRHPNLATAQRLTQQAFEKISAAQEANEFDMDGHAKKAKELLDEASRELKQAAETANRNPR